MFVGWNCLKSGCVTLAAIFKKLLKIKKKTSDTKNLTYHMALSLLLMRLKKYAYHME